MPDSVYNVIQLIGTSTESWEKAAAAAIETASHSLRDLRVAEVVELDLVIEKAKSPPTARSFASPSNTKVTTPDNHRAGQPPRSKQHLAHPRPPLQSKRPPNAVFRRPQITSITMHPMYVFFFSDWLSVSNAARMKGKRRTSLLRCLKALPIYFTE